MQIQLTPEDINTLLREADRAARRLRRKLCLPACEREDLRQDLLVDLLRRLPAYDPSRGTIGAFAGVVLSNRCVRLAIRHHRQRRAQGGTMLSLDAPVADSVEPLGCLLAEADGLAAWHGQDRDTQADIQTRDAVQSALARLPEADRRFCGALAHRSVAALAAEGFGSRSALYRRLAELRHVLTARGLGPAWDDLASA